MGFSSLYVLQMGGQKEPGMIKVCNILIHLKHQCLILASIFFPLNLLDRVAVKCLHASFLIQKKTRQEEVLNLLRILEGRTKRESARLFYEILVCTLVLSNTLSD
jgi:uncharacterized membrane protein YbjE (DUF340 family)